MRAPFAPIFSAWDVRDIASSIEFEPVPAKKIKPEWYKKLPALIEDVDGNILMTRLMRPGETYVVPNINGLTFNTGNAGALSLSQGNVIVPKLGEVGEIITARPLNIKTFSNKQILD